jgi:hypothetical protein
VLHCIKIVTAALTIGKKGTAEKVAPPQRANKTIFHEAPHTVAQLYGLPHGILNVFNTILYENEFQNPQIFQQTLMSVFFFPEQSTLGYDVALSQALSRARSTAVAILIHQLNKTENHFSHYPRSQVDINNCTQGSKSHDFCWCKPGRSK